jgi:amino acid adenylation domain-containing protein
MINKLATMDELDKRAAALSPAKRALLAQRLKERGTTVEGKGIRRNIGQGPIPLSFNQEALWFLHQLEPDSPVDNLPYWLRFQGELNLSALQRCLNEVLRRHEILRTRIEAVEGLPVQVVDSFTPLEIPLVDLSELPAQQREAEAKRLCTNEAQKPFNLARDLMLRARLFRLEQSDHVLFLNRHHIASDGWSWGVLMRELETLYQAFSKERPSPLAELPVQYADFAMWQRAWLQDDVLERQLRYWQKQLDGAPASLELPTDRRGWATPNHCGALLSYDLPESLSLAVGELSRREGVTLFMTLLAAFQTLLHRYTSRDDIPVGSVVAGRNRTELEGLIGYFTNTLVFRGDLSGDPSFRILLQRTRTVCVGAYAHQDMPFGELVKELEPERAMSHSPLFQVMFLLQNAPVSAMTLPGLRVTATDRLDTGASHFELSLSLTESGNSLNASVEYRTDLFDAETIRRLLSHYQNLLEGIAANPDARLSELPLLAEGERHQLLVEWNQTQQDFPRNKCIQELFEEQVERTPEDIAVVFEEEELSYAELNRHANQLAHRLRKLGVGPEVIVGVFAERSVEMVVGLLATLKAGGAYLPLDPNYPADRLNFMLGDARPGLVLVQGSLAAKLPQYAGEVVFLEDDFAAKSDANPTNRTQPENLAEWGTIARCPTRNPISGVSPENLAYVIYTSGSTGRPKGVMVRHRGVCNRLQWVQENLPLGSGDGMMLKAPLTFDVSVSEVFWPLMSGARLVVARGGLQGDGRYLIETICKQAVTTLELVPAMLAALLEDKEVGRCSSLRRVICGGEGLAADLQQRFFRALPHAELYNSYGPTEATIDVTFWKCELGAQDTNPPIGRPIANTQAYILDRAMQPVPVGVGGELHIGGVQVARCYLARPELTAEKFVPNPFGAGRIYKTGDLCRFRSDGAIEFLGRMDQQVKLRGLRIELGEIEAVLKEHPAVRECVALVRQDKTGSSSKLVCYVVARGVSPDELRQHARKTLPDYMVPSAFVFLEELPLTANRKLDRRALPEPEYQVEQFIEPQTPLQRQLATIWQDVLGVERVGLESNFFELGGHSLMATQLIARVRDKFKINLPLVKVFESPTVSDLSADIEQILVAEVEAMSEEEIQCLLDCLPDAQTESVPK